MGATIICKDSVKAELSEILVREINGLVEEISTIEEVSVVETPDGLRVEYPMGEIYGQAYDYVEMLPSIFKKLKKGFKDIGIDGIVYEYEINTAMTLGFVFHCKPKNAELKISDRWQLCAVCKNYFETDVFYNSSQWDFGEGNLLCLCAHWCAQDYIRGEHRIFDVGVEPNASVSEEDSERFYEGEITLAELLKARLAGN